MKCLISDIKKFAVHDGDGIRTTVFFKGCPLECLWCHNPEGISFKPQLAYYESKCVGCGECVTACRSSAHMIEGGIHSFDRALCTACGECADGCLGEALTLYGREMSVEELLPELLSDRAFYESSGGGVTLSGGECLCHSEFCVELLRELKKEGINTAIDTCGHVPREVFDAVIPYTDTFLYDIKAADPEVHKKCTKKTNERILDNLRYLDKRGCRIEVRIPFVPGFNSDEIEKIGEILSGLKNLCGVRVLPYHNYAGSKYASLGMTNRLPDRLPTDDEINAVKDTLRSYGIKII